MGATGYIMEPFDAYKYYMPIKLHFESDSYDAPKYNFKTSISPQSFWKRRDKYHFAKLSRKFNKPDELVGIIKRIKEWGRTDSEAEA